MSNNILDWDKLSMKQRAAYIRLGVANGYRDIDSIKLVYNEYLKGGTLRESLEEPSMEELVSRVNNSKADFVQRLKDPNRAAIQDWEHPEKVATHKMSVSTDADNNVYIYPEVQNINGKLVDFTRPPFAPWVGQAAAEERGDTVRVPNIDTGIRFSKNYKGYYPGFDKYALGGPLITEANKFAIGGETDEEDPTYWGGLMNEVVVRPNQEPIVISPEVSKAYAQEDAAREAAMKQAGDITRNIHSATNKAAPILGNVLLGAQTAPLTIGLEAINQANPTAGAIASLLPLGPTAIKGIAGAGKRILDVHKGTSLKLSDLSNIEKSPWFKNLVNLYGLSNALYIANLIKTPEFLSYLWGSNPTHAKAVYDRFAAQRDLISKIAGNVDEGKSAIAGSASLMNKGNLGRPMTNTGAVAHDIDVNAYMGNASKTTNSSAASADNLALFDYNKLMASPIFKTIQEAYPTLFRNAVIKRTTRLDRALQGLNRWWDRDFTLGLYLPNPFPSSYREGVFNITPMFNISSEGANRVVMTKINGEPLDIFLSDRYLPTDGIFMSPLSTLNWKQSFINKHREAGLPLNKKHLADILNYRLFSKENPIIDAQGNVLYAPFAFKDKALIDSLGFPILSPIETYPGSNLFIPAFMNYEGRFLPVIFPKNPTNKFAGGGEMDEEDSAYLEALQTAKHEAEPYVTPANSTKVVKDIQVPTLVLPPVTPEQEAMYRRWYGFPSIVRGREGEIGYEKPKRIRSNNSSTKHESEWIEDTVAKGIIFEKSDPVYDIPFDPTKAILLGGSTTSTNVLDSLAKYAAIHNADPKLADKPILKKDKYKKPRPINKNEMLGLSYLETRNGAWPLGNIYNDVWYTPKGLANSNYFTAYDYIPANKLVRDFHYNVLSDEEREATPPLLDAFRFYAEGDYNRGDPNHTHDVNKAGEEAWKNKAVQNWWKLSGDSIYNYWFDKTKKSNIYAGGGSRSRMSSVQAAMQAQKDKEEGIAKVILLPEVDVFAPYNASDYAADKTVRDTNIGFKDPLDWRFEQIMGHKDKADTYEKEGVEAATAKKQEYNDMQKYLAAEAAKNALFIPFGSAESAGWRGIDKIFTNPKALYRLARMNGRRLLGNTGADAVEGYKPFSMNPTITSENAASKIPNIIRTVQDNGKIRLSLPSHTENNPRQFVLEPQGDNKFYVHMRTWDGDHIPANLTNEEKQQLFDALYNELPEGAEILFPKSGPDYYGTRGTVAGLQRLARDSRFTPGTKGTLQYLDKDGKTIKTYEGTSFIKAPRITAENAANITPKQWTAAQDAAIARGDMAEAQRLRDLHFQVSAPNTKINVPLWSSSEEAFNSFDLSHFGETDSGFFGYGHYLTPIEKYAATYHPINRKFYANIENPYIGSNDQYFNRIQYVKDRLAMRKENVMRNLRDGKLTKFSKKLGINENTSLEDAERLVDKYIADETVKWNDKYAKYVDEFEGKDGVLSWRELQGIPNKQEGIYKEVVVPRGEQIKSAEAVTFDDNGVRIPLGERDNFNINDNRYSWLPWVLGAGATETIYGTQNNRALGGPLVERANSFQSGGILENTMSGSSEDNTTPATWEELVEYEQQLADKKEVPLYDYKAKIVSIPDTFTTLPEFLKHEETGYRDPIGVSTMSEANGINYTDYEDFLNKSYGDWEEYDPQYHGKELGLTFEEYINNQLLKQKYNGMKNPIFIGGSTNDARYKYFQQHPELITDIKEISKELRVPAQAIASRLAHEGFVDDQIAYNNAFNDSPSKFDLNSVRAANDYRELLGNYYQHFGLDLVGSQIYNGEVTVPEKYKNFYSIEEGEGQTNERGEEGRWINLKNNKAGIVLMAARMAADAERIKKDFPNADESTIATYLPIYYNRANPKQYILNRLKNGKSVGYATDTRIADLFK